MITSTLIALGIALAAVWVALGAVVLARALRSPGQPVGEILRVFPDSLRLAVALYRDRAVPSSVRTRLRIALIYNLQPVNLIPDVVPVIGLADNVAVLAWGLRSAVRIAGPDAVARHWKGSPESLTVLCRVLRLSGADASSRPRGEGA